MSASPDRETSTPVIGQHAEQGDGRARPGAAREPLAEQPAEDRRPHRLGADERGGRGHRVYWRLGMNVPKWAARKRRTAARGRRRGPGTRRSSRTDAARGEGQRDRGADAGPPEGDGQRRRRRGGDQRSGGGGAPARPRRAAGRPPRAGRRPAARRSSCGPVARGGAGHPCQCGSGGPPPGSMVAPRRSTSRRQRHERARHRARSCGAGRPARPSRTSPCRASRFPWRWCGGSAA